MENIKKLQYNIILHDGENVLIRVENDKKTKTYTYWLYDDMFTKGIDDLLFWAYHLSATRHRW